MPNWDGIEDVSPRPLRVWLTRVKETDNWTPLRKVDCWALNESKDSVVMIDGGRFTADKEKKTVTANFLKTPVKTLASAIWFIRKDVNSKDKESNLEPIFSDDDTNKMETLYQRAIEACGSFGQGIDEIIKEEIELDDGSKIKVVKTNGGTVLCMKKQPPGWLTGRQDLQRGYGTYSVDGEDNELMLGPVKHLYFVVHGVGESIWSREDVSMSSLVEDVTKVRINIQTRQIDAWRKQCEKNKKEGIPVPVMPDRVEFIPIEWWDRIHSSSNALTRSLNAATLPTIPAFRAIANAAVFDVLMYLTPTFCEQVLECVNTQITQHYNRFLQIHPNFLANGGKCSLIGHSLGSVICWDLLAILKNSQAPPIPTSTGMPRQRFGSGVGGGGRESSGGIAIASTNADTVDVGYQAYVEENADIAQNGVWGPTLPQQMEATLPFTPENAVFLGSPIGMFLTLRGAHPVFDELRKEKTEQIIKEFEAQEASTEVVVKEPTDQQSTVKAGIKEVEIQSERQLPELPFASPFTLGVNGGIYNVFHPSDPVAYRIEPLLLSPETDEKDFPPPVHLTVEGEGVRFHVQAQEIGGKIAKLVDGSNRSFSQFLNKAVAALGQSTTDPDGANARGLPGVNGYPTGPQIFALGGKSERVDFQLQRNVVDSEYLSAVTAHSTYFVNTDVQDFVMSLAAKASAKPGLSPTPENLPLAVAEPMDTI